MAGIAAANGKAADIAEAFFRNRLGGWMDPGGFQGLRPVMGNEEAGWKRRLTPSDGGALYAWQRIEEVTHLAPDLSSAFITAGECHLLNLK